MRRKRSIIWLVGAVKATQSHQSDPFSFVRRVAQVLGDRTDLTPHDLDGYVGAATRAK